MDTPTILWEEMEFNTFAEGELVLLKLFHEQVTQIYESSFIKNGLFKCSLDGNIVLGRTDGEDKILLHGPEEANIRSILLPLRLLILSNDETNIRIERILKILKYKSANDKTKSYFETLIRNYHNRENVPTFTLRGIKGEYTEEDIFELWANGYYFHKDISKRKELEDLSRSMPLSKPALKYVLLKVIIDSCKWAKLIDEILVNALFPKVISPI